MPDPTGGILAGLALGGGVSGLGGLFADDERDTQRRINRAFEDTLRASFQNDPLLNQILGGLAGMQGMPFDEQEAFQRGQEQIQLTRERREFDALRQLAAFGFDQGGSQQEFVSNALGQQEGAETANLQNLVSQAAIQARPQALLGDFDLFSGLLGQTLALGGQAGLLGVRAPEGQAQQPVQMGGMAGGMAFNPYMPQAQNAEFF